MGVGDLFRYLVWDTSKVALEEHYLSDATFAGSAGLSTMAAGFTRLDVQALKRREVVWNNILNRGLSVSPSPPLLP